MGRKSLLLKERLALIQQVIMATIARVPRRITDATVYIRGFRPNGRKTPLAIVLFYNSSQYPRDIPVNFCFEPVTKQIMQQSHQIKA